MTVKSTWQLQQKVKLLLALYCLILPGVLHAQGFNWQWTAKSPSTNPKNYAGANAKYNLQYLLGDITFLEDKVSCPSFNNGNGYSLATGANFERWEAFNRFCYKANVQFEHLAVISKSIDYVPLTPDLTGEYETELKMTIDKINFSGGIKHRLPGTHFHFSAEIMLSFVVSHNYEVTETILGPAEVPPFQTVPPAYSRTVIAGKIEQVNQFLIQPVLGIGYDIPLARGTYIEPGVSFTFPGNNILANDNVKNYSFAFGIKLLTALW